MGGVYTCSLAVKILHFFNDTVSDRFSSCPKPVVRFLSCHLSKPTSTSLEFQRLASRNESNDCPNSSDYYPRK